MAAPAFQLVGCREYAGTIRLPPGSNLVKSGWSDPARGAAQYAYRHADTGTWYQVTTLYDARRPPPAGSRRWKVCEYVGSDCPCAGGSGAPPPGGR